MPRGAMAEPVAALAVEARRAARAMAGLPAAAREEALLALRRQLVDARESIEAANREDKRRAEAAALAPALLKRLDLEGAKFEAMLAKIDEVRELPDPLNRVSYATMIDEDLELRRISCPIGVICVIFESRPEAAVQIASLALKSANAVILKGGKEAANTNAALVAAMQGALSASGVLPARAVQLVSGREEVNELLGLTGLIDLVVPRGSNQLVASIMANTHSVLSHNAMSTMMCPTCFSPPPAIHPTLPSSPSSLLSASHAHLGLHGCSFVSIPSRL